MSFNFMAAITICSDFGAPKIKSDTVYIVTYKPHGSHRPKIYNRYIRTKRKESKHNTKLSHQITKEQKRKGRKNTYENKSRTISKMAIITYISIITLNVNRLNHPNKRERLAE